MYEWDEGKSQLNKRKHGISFTQAKVLFEDPKHLILRAKLVQEETRLAVIGMFEGKLWTCIVTERDDSIRIISCRRAREKEARIYEQAKENS